MDILNLIFNTVGGASAGYITNSFAVKMLFRKYGPLGGVIIKTRAEFIKNTSYLVEREIINHHTLEDELETEEVEKVFYNIIDDIISKRLPEKINQSSLADIPGHRETTANSIDFLFEKKVKLIKSVEKYEIIEDIFDKEQIEYITERLYIKTVDQIKDGDNRLIEDVLSVVYDDLSKKNLKDLLDPDFLERIGSNIEKELTDIDQFIESGLHNETDDLLEDLYQILDIDRLIKNFIDEAKKKKIKGFLESDNWNSFANLILEKLISAFHSKKGKKVYNQFLNDLINLLDESDLLWEDIFVIDSEKKLYSFFEGESDFIFSLIEGWLDDNKNEIEDLFTQSVEDVLESGSSFKNTIQKFIYNLFADGGLDDYDIVDRLKEFLQKKIDLDRAVEKLKKEKEKTGPGDMLKYLVETDILSAENIADLLEKNNEKIIEIATEKMVCYFSDKKIADLFDLELSDFLLKKIKNILLNQLRDSYIYTERLSKDIVKSYNSYLDNLKKIKLEEIISSDMIKNNSVFLENFILDKLSVWKPSIINWISDLVEKNMRSDKFVSMARQLEKNKHREDLIENFTKKIIGKLDKIEGSRISANISNVGQYSKRLSLVIIELVKNNLPKMLNDRIQNTVAGSLNKLDDAAIQQAVEDFMGKELKPITWLGAGLGSIGGLLLYLLTNLTVIDLTALSGPLLTAFTYGTIGYLTNVIALQMIFRPYNEKNILGFSLPFTPGVIGKNKTRFASSMGRFVDDQLLEAGSVSEIFEEKKYDIIDQIKENISEDNYYRVKKFIDENSEELSVDLSKLILTYFKNNKRKIPDYLVNNLVELSIGDLEFITDYLYPEESIENFIFNKEFIISLISEIEEKTSVEQSLLELIDEKQLANLMDNNLNSLSDYLLDNIVDFIERDSISDLISTSIGKTGDITLDQILIDQDKEEIKDKFKNHLVDINLTDILGEVFPDGLIDILSNNKEMVYHYLENILITYFQENRDQFKEELKDIAEAKISDGNSSFLGRMVFGFAGMDELLERIVDDLIDEKLPELFSKKEDELLEIIISYLEHLRKRRVDEIGIKYNDDISCLAAKKLDIHLLYKKLDEIFASKLDLSYILDFLDDEIDLFLNPLHKSLIENREDIRKELEGYIGNLFMEKLKRIKLVSIFSNIDKNDIKNSLNFIGEELKKDQIITKNSDIIVDSLFSQIQTEKLGFFIDSQSLKESIELLITKNEDKIEFDLKKLINLFIVNSEFILDKKTVNYLVDLSLEVGTDSLEDHFIELIDSLNIKEITEREVNEMSPEEIENLFYSFAGKYFKRLKAYGWSGSGFGLLAEFILKYLG